MNTLGMILIGLVIISIVSPVTGVFILIALYHFFKTLLAMIGYHEGTWSTNNMIHGWGVMTGIILIFVVIPVLIFG